MSHPSLKLSLLLNINNYILYGQHIFWPKTLCWKGLKPHQFSAAFRCKNSSVWKLTNSVLLLVSTNSITQGRMAAGQSLRGTSRSPLAEQTMYTNVQNFPLLVPESRRQEGKQSKGGERLKEIKIKWTELLYINVWFIMWCQLNECLPLAKVAGQVSEWWPHDELIIVYSPDLLREGNQQSFLASCLAQLLEWRHHITSEAPRILRFMIFAAIINTPKRMY